MGRLGMIAVTVVALAAIFYGIVLNGFGLFDGPRPPEVAVPETDPDASDPDEPALPSRQSADRKPAPSGEPAPAGETATLEPATPAGEDPLPPPERVARNVTPPNVLQMPVSRYVEPSAETESAPEQEEARPTRFHRVVVEDAGTLKAGKTVIHLAGIDPVAPDRTCTDDTGQEWPCGRVATAALRMLIRNRSIDCSEQAATDDGFTGTCSVGLEDINGWLVEHGWAEPTAGDYSEAAESARSARRGVHVAEWRANAPEPVAVPESGFTAPAIPPEPGAAPPPQIQPPQGQSPQIQPPQGQPLQTQTGPVGAPVDLSPRSPVQ